MDLVGRVQPARDSQWEQEPGSFSRKESLPPLVPRTSPLRTAPRHGSALGRPPRRPIRAPARRSGSLRCARTFRGAAVYDLRWRERFPARPRGGNAASSSLLPSLPPAGVRRRIWGPIWLGLRFWGFCGSDIHEGV